MDEQEFSFYTPNNGAWECRSSMDIWYIDEGQAPSVAAPARPRSEAAPLELTDIPGAMQKMGWHVAAALLNKWFHYTPKNEATNSFQKGHGYHSDGSGAYPRDRIDTTTVKLDWILSFPRAARVFKELQNTDRLGNNAALQSFLARLYSYKHYDGWINPLHACGNDIHRLHRNFQFQRALVDTSALEKAETFFRAMLHHGLPDDLAGALGGFEFCAAIAKARIKPVWRGSEVQITKVALYMHNPYSFFDDAGGSQYLGHWNRDGIALVPFGFAAQKAGFGSWSHYAVQPEGPYGRTFWPVHNSDFRRWQEQHNAGGDMVLYSDYRIVTLKTPVRMRM